MRIGYARVSTQQQDNAAQLAALRAAGCSRIFEEKVSAGRWDRPELRRLLDQLRDGDVLVVWKLDRLSRSLKELLSLLEKVQLADAGFLSLTEAVETTTAAGRMMMQMVGAFAEFERAMLRERTRNGLLAARQEGRIGGRRPKLTAATTAGGRSPGGLRRTNGSRRRPAVQCSPLHHCPAAGQGQAGFAGLAYDFFRFLQRAEFRGMPPPATLGRCSNVLGSDLRSVHVSTHLFVDTSILVRSSPFNVTWPDGYSEDAAKLRQWQAFLNKNHIEAGSLSDTVSLLDDLLWPPTEIAAACSQATATWRPEALRWA